ncbi:MAG TPA: dTDP-4-dehydrorhamnose reductase [Thermoleophilia bacterium]|nr:dTDP-4-dehydrorhamnose reductase [Thermoleophilia bacterium]
MPRWFVTGAGGQLATAFSRILDGEVFLSREEALDIRDPDAVRTAVRGFAPDAVLHCAAYTNVDGAEADRAAAEAVNVLGTRNVVEAVRGTHTSVVYFSTDYVFDGAKGAPYVETDRPRPLNVYGRTKLAGERDVLSWAHGIVFRTSWLFSETGHNFVKTILAAAQERAGTGKPLRVVDDQVGSPTYAGHLAAAVDEALRRGLGPGIYHLAGSGYCSWCELAGEVVDLAGLQVDVEPITTAEAGRPARRPAFSALDTERPIPRLPHWAEGVAEAVDRLIPLG